MTYVRAWEGLPFDLVEFTQRLSYLISFMNVIILQEPTIFKNQIDLDNIWFMIMKAVLMKLYDCFY